MVSGCVTDSAWSYGPISRYAMTLIYRRMTRKRFIGVFPACAEFAAKLAHPLLDNIDAVHWSQTARVLRIGGLYAERLLEGTYGEGAERIAHALVEDYPDHNYFLDIEEAQRDGLRVEELPNDT